MSQEINLLTNVQQEKTATPFFTLSLLILLITILFTVAIFLYVLFVKSSISQVTQMETDTLAKMQSLAEKKVKLLSVQERVSSIQTIVPANSELPKRLNGILQNLPGGLTVNIIQMVGASVVVGFSAGNLASINTFLNTNLSDLLIQQKLGIKSIEIQSFGLSSEGLGYDTVIKFTFKTSVN